MLEIQDPKHDEHEDLLEWVGGEFDPEGFDVDEVTKSWHPFGNCQRREP